MRSERHVDITTIVRGEVWYGGPDRILVYIPPQN